MTTVNLLELVSFIDAGLDLVSGRKPPDAVETESQLPALARGDVVSSMDMDFDGRVAGLRCCDVLLLSVFSARAAIVTGARKESKQAHSCCKKSVSGTVSCSFFRSTQGVQLPRPANTRSDFARPRYRRAPGALAACLLLFGGDLAGP